MSAEVPSLNRALAGVVAHDKHYTVGMINSAVLYTIDSRIYLA